MAEIKKTQHCGIICVDDNPGASIVFASRFGPLVG